MITRHSLERVFQRTNCNRKSAPRIIENAAERGLPMSEFPEKERRYLERKASKTSGNVCVVYNGAIFILTSDKECITVLTPPRWFGKKQFYNGKTVIRDPKKAISYNLMNMEE